TRAFRARLIAGSRLTLTEADSAFVSTPKLFVQRCQRLVGSAEYRRVLVQNDINRNLCQLIAQFQFVTECPDETPILQFGKNLQGNSSGDIDTPKWKDSQGHVSGFCTVRLRPNLQRLQARRARSCESLLRNFGCGIHSGFIKE